MIKKFVLLVIMLTICYFPSKSQNFYISNITCNQCEDDDCQKAKTEFLGLKVKITTYDASIKVSVTNKAGKLDDAVLDRSSTDNNTYIYKNKQQHTTSIVTLNKTIAYINSATIFTTEDNKGTIIFTLKRE